MNQDRLMAQGKLAELQIREKDLRIKIENTRDAIRTECFEFKPIEEIRGDHVAGMSIELAEALISYKEARDEMAAIKKALGLK